VVNPVLDWRKIVTSEEIKNGTIYANGISDTHMTQAYWLKEIAYQLAVSNERREPTPLTTPTWAWGGTLPTPILPNDPDLQKGQNR
jgi:hypothetical protein